MLFSFNEQARFGLWLALVVCCHVVPPALAQTAGPAADRPLTLDTLLAQVRAENPTLQAARLDARALATRPAQARALPDPTFGVLYQPFPILTARGAQRTQWRVEQMLPYPGTRTLRGDVAALEAEGAAHETEVLAADLALQAKQAYYALYRVQQLEALVRSFAEELERFEEVAAVRYEVGQGTQQAILKAQLEKNGLAQRLIDLQVQRRRAAEILAHLTNRPGGAAYFQTVAVEVPPVPEAEAEALLAFATEARPEAAVLATAAERADRAVALAEKAFRPDFGVSVTYFDIAAREMPATATGRDAIALGAMVKVPLQRTRLRAQLEEARLRREAVRARQEALRSDFQTQLEDLRHALVQEAATLRLYRETLLPQAASTVEATLAAYTTGRLGFLDLLDAERTQFSLREGYEEALARYLKTTAALERALGLTSLAELPILVSTSRGAGWQDGERP